MRSMRVCQQTHPADFAYKMNDMLHQPSQGHKQGTTVRAVCENFIVECIKFEKTSTVRPVLFLAEKAHKA